jgi:hypothetical protein
MSTVTAINRGRTPQPAPRHPVCPAVYTKCAPHTMHAHRLWIKLWITLGHPEENFIRPEGNAGVTRRGTPAAHSCPARCAHASHRRCAQPQRALAGRIIIIPGIHRPYDDYQICNGRQNQIKVGKRPASTRVRSARRNVAS